MAAWHIGFAAVLREAFCGMCAVTNADPASVQHLSLYSETVVHFCLHLYYGASHLMVICVVKCNCEPCSQLCFMPISC